MDKRIIMFHHCGREVYCFFVPEQCPICGQGLAARSLGDAPVCVPNPFVNGHHEKCSFLVKPTKGTFIREYDGHSDLHVGISNTSGVVYNFTEVGVRREACGWEECVSVALVQPDMFGLMDRWDHYLEQISRADLWLPHRYEESEHNCYAFALTFINRVLAAQTRRQLSRTEFTERFVLPKTRRGSRYLTLYRELCRSYFYIVDTQDSGQT